MTRRESIQLFHSMHPGFFEKEAIRNFPDEWIFDEMVLSLDTFEPCRYSRKLDADISFGYYRGDISEIKKAVEKVDPDWPQYYTEGQRIYCAYIGEKIASFCIIGDLGVYNINGRTVKVGGPGCVGTLPEYRDRGIGLTMVKHVTQILKDEGYDHSYIHFTSVAPWYEKLGRKRDCVKASSLFLYRNGEEIWPVIRYTEDIERGQNGPDNLTSLNIEVKTQRKVNVIWNGLKD